MTQPRVFFDDDTVPAGTAVLYASGEVGYLDETGDCSHEPRAGETCDDCSFDVDNGNFGPLVELLLPDYRAVVEAAERARSDSPREFCTFCYEFTEIGPRNGHVKACFDCAAVGEMDGAA